MVFNILRAGLFPSERELANAWHFAFDEAPAVHFRELYRLSPRDLRTFIQYTLDDDPQQ